MVYSLRPVEHELLHERAPDDWRDDAMSLRWTCRDFSNLVAPSLFHDFYLYPIGFSMDYFAALSQSPTIAPLVRRLVFMRPQFARSCLDRSVYANLLDRGAGISYEQRRMSGLSSEGSENLPLHKYGYNVYKTGWEEQNKLMKSGRYVKLCALFTTKLKNLSAVVISGGNGDHGPTPRLPGGTPYISTMRRNFLQTRCPRVKLDPHGHATLHERSTGTNQKFISSVLSVHALARTQVVELSFSGGLGIHPDLRKCRTSAVWRHMRFDNIQTLDLRFQEPSADDEDFDDGLASDRIANTDQEEEQDEPADLAAMFETLLQSASTTLTNLTVGSAKSSVNVGSCFDDFVTGAILTKTLPSLKEMHIIKHADAPADSLVRFLQLNPELPKLVLEGHSMSPGGWRKLFIAKRAYPRIRLGFCGCYTPCLSPSEKGLQVMLTTILSTRPKGAGAPMALPEETLEVLHVDLEAYLHGDGVWTYALATLFPSDGAEA